VIGPEGAAVILERDVHQARAVADHLGLTATELVRLGIVDEVVPDDLDATCDAVVEALDVAKPGDRLRRVDAASAASWTTRL
jgi:acetyl-CoA carboxylase carboxyl transferase subunit alpha